MEILSLFDRFQPALGAFSHALAATYYTLTSGTRDLFLSNTVLTHRKPRLHRQFLEVVKLELEGLGIHDINNVQAI